jgi:hypothetical protein
MKSYDGMLEVTVKDQWLRLKDARGKQIGCRSLQKGDCFSIGTKLFFPIHIVRVGIPMATTSGRTCMDHAVLAPVVIANKDKAPEEVLDTVLRHQSICLLNRI